MSVTIDLPPEIEANLAEQAAARGVSLAEHLRRVLAEQARASKPTRKPPGERARHWRDVSGLPDAEPLSDEAISRESIYGEREENGALAAELLALGRDCAAPLKEPWRSADHAELLYDERGLPR